MNTPASLGLSIACLWAVVPAAHAQENTRLEPVKDLMQQLSQDFRRVESAAEGNNAKRLLEFAQALKGHVADISNIAARRQPAQRAEIRTYGERLAARTTDLIVWARKGELGPARDAIEAIRNSCVSCHLQFRSDNDGRGLFPARGNTIYGYVDLITSAGERREDRSDVVVFLDSVPGKWRPPRQNPGVSQKNRRFTPTVLPIVKGTTVDFPNDDVVFHNVFSLSRKKPFDLDIYGSGKSKSVTFPQTGLVRVYCNIHPDMAADILVLDNPFFATTSRSGFFAITGVPDGSHVLRIWHRFGGEDNRKLDVSESEKRELRFEIREVRKRIQHRNKFGRPYRRKYR